MLIMSAEIVGESEEELLEEEEDEVPAPRRPWLLLILSPLLALLALWAALQWRSGLDREDRLRAELRQVYQEAETLRLEAAQAQQKGAVLERRVAELSGEKKELTNRVAELTARLKGSKERRPPARPAPSRR